MSNSSLVTYTKISPNKTSPRNHVIDTISIHCMAGNLSIEKCGDVFTPTSRRASSNYGIGSDGRIGMYVEESDRSWCTSSASNDHRAITIEVANDGGEETGWHISDKAMSSLIDLLVDICQRNDIKELKWKADKSLIGKVDQQNMTVHRWFAAKACPGDYLYGKHGEIAEKVNARLGKKPTPAPTPTPSPTSQGLEVKSTVKDIQIYLNTYYGKQIKKVIGAELVVDGSFGAKSKKAIAIAIQTELNKMDSKLAIDGDFGTKSATSFTKNVGTLKRGLKGSIFVTLWQCFLVGCGLDPKGIDGSFGNGCMNASNIMLGKYGLSKDSSVSGTDLNTIF